MSAHLRLAEKQREYEAFLQIAAQNKQFVEFLNQYAKQYDVLAQGSHGVSEVVVHWQNVFRVTNLALTSLLAQQIPTSATDDTPMLPPGAMPDRIVRIPAAEAASPDDA